MNRSAPLALLLAFGCAEEVAEPELLLPTAVSVEWDAAWNGADDGLGALVPVDVMVYDGATGEPIEGVEVLVSAADEGVLPVPVEGVLVVDDETDTDALWDASRDQYVAFDTDLVPLVSASDPDGDYEPSDREALEYLDELLLETDDGGIARLYLYVDAFPRSDGEFDSSRRRSAALEFVDMPVVVAMSARGVVAERTFHLVPR